MNSKEENVLVIYFCSVWVLVACVMKMTNK